MWYVNLTALILEITLSVISAPIGYNIAEEERKEKEAKTNL